MSSSPPGAPMRTATASSRRVKATMIFSLLLHLLFTWSVFDIYFTSPVVHPERHFAVNDTYMVPPADGIPGSILRPDPWATWSQNDPLLFGGEQPDARPVAKGLNPAQMEELKAEAGEDADALLHMLEHADDPVRVGGFMDMEVYRDLQTPAKRLVLLVGDGLRADTLFKHHSWSALPPWARRDISTSPTEEMVYASALLPDKGNTTDLTWENTSALYTAAPFLNDIASKRGAWGLSHTRVPTESRPGHVALIAGMYEDVSAVTKGWKTNPIPFDSVFNQSTHTYSFGSPDILPMFAQGAASDKIDMWTYREEDEDFTKDATHLDLWVLDELNHLFAQAKENVTLNAQLKRPGTVFFLHLLGLDTTGHTYGPASVEYVGNTIVVDAIARQVEKAMQDFFDDIETAYVFTADHGMSNKGNHGDGDPDNTRTPLVAWGAGVRPPLQIPKSHAQSTARKHDAAIDPYYRDWRSVEEIYRSDVEQADVAALMTGLLGSPFPGNSEGRLPADYLLTSEEYSVRAMLANALEILEMYRTKHAERARRTIGYKEFDPLRDVNAPTEDLDEFEETDLPGDQMVHEAKYFIMAGEYDEAIPIIKDLVKLSLEGIKYLQHYDWSLLASLIVAGYIGSILNGVAFLVQLFGLTPEQYEASISKPRSCLSLGWILPAVSFSFLAAKFTIEEAPATYFFYAAATAALWSRVSSQLSTFKAVATSQVVTRVALGAVPVLILLETIVVGYLVRIAWTLGFVLIGVVWPLALVGPRTIRQNPWSWFAWTATCLSNSLFTLETLDKKESVTTLIATGVLFFHAGIAIYVYGSSWIGTKGHPDDLKRTRRVLIFELLALIAATVFTTISSNSLQAKQGLPLFSQVGGWIVLVSCLTIPFMYGFVRRQGDLRQPPAQRIVITVFAFAPIFILLSICDEGLFFGSFTLSLFAWVRVEAILFAQSSPNSSINASALRLIGLQDARIALFFLFFLHAAFFGTGNIASISSFYLPPVYRLVPIFSPFLMAALLLLKILVPLVLLCAAFQVLCLSPRFSDETGLLSSGIQLGSASPLVLAAGLATDALALNFFFAIKTEGSWLEIGQTITHFVLANLLQVFMLALTAVTSAMFLGSRPAPAHSKTA